MGKSGSNVLNVFKGSSLTGHRVYVYSEPHSDIYYILKYFLIHCVYSKILNANNEFCCLCENIYLSEVSTFFYVVVKDELFIVFAVDNYIEKYCQCKQ